MRIIVMFDLPVVSSEDRREYTRFRKFLIKSGFLMMQESVYCKMVPNSEAGEFLVKNVENNKPPKGLVQLLKVTEKQYAKMIFVVGEHNGEVIDSDERIIIL